MKHVTLKWFNENIDSLLSCNEQEAYLCVHENTEVNYGFNADVNLEYCKEHNIKAFHMLRDGGCIVCSKGNVGVSQFSHVSGGWVCGKFIEAFMDFLKSKGIEDVESSNNDILVDGYKVASCVEMRIPNNIDWIYSTYQISINQDIEAIQNICMKPMVKIPKALSDYGISTEEVVEWCDNWFE